MILRKPCALHLTALSFWLAAPAAAREAPPIDMEKAQERAVRTVREMTADEKVILTHGIMPLSFGPAADTPIPAEAIPGAGYVPGIERLYAARLDDMNVRISGCNLCGGCR